MSDEIGISREGSFADEITANIAREVIEDSFVEEEGRAACLLFLTGPMMGHCVSLDTRARQVGRADDADIVIKDQGVSRRHARFFLGEAAVHGSAESRDEKNVPDAFVEDLDSSNGVYVNGQRIEKVTQLFQGDKITLGTETVLRFTYQDQIDQDFQQRLLDSAINDALTGTRNRAYFDQQFKYEFDYAVRHGSVLALLMFDIDYFKQVNDTHGHLAGDAVLTQLGARLGDAIREEDFLARYGGEEFAMICRELSLEQAFRAAERLRKKVAEKPFEYQGTSIELSVSVGVASYPETAARSGIDLLAATDRALYRAKKSGRNQTFKATAQDLPASGE